MTNADDAREESRQLDELEQSEASALAELEAQGALPREGVVASVVAEICGVAYERDGRTYPEICQLEPGHKRSGHDDADHFHGNIGWWRGRA